MRVGVLCLDPITQKCTRSIIFLLASILNIETITGLCSAQFLVKRYRNCKIPWWRCLTQEENHIRQTPPRFYTNAIIVEVSLYSSFFRICNLELMVEFGCEAWRSYLELLVRCVSSAQKQLQALRLVKLYTWRNYIFLQQKQILLRTISLVSSDWQPQITFLKRFLGNNNYSKVTHFVVDYKSFSFGILNHTYS